MTVTEKVIIYHALEFVLSCLLVLLASMEDKTEKKAFMLSQNTKRLYKNCCQT